MQESAPSMTPSPDLGSICRKKTDPESYDTDSNI